MSALAIEGLTKSFGKHVVLRGVDLSVEEHEVVALIGASGSGKSTLLRCINLLEAIDEGRIFLGDREITGARDVNAVRRRIGIVFQSFNLFPHMNVLRNVTLAPRDVLGLSKAEADERAARAARAVRPRRQAPRVSRPPVRAVSSSASRSCARSRCSPS